MLIAGQKLTAFAKSMNWESIQQMQTQKQTNYTKQINISSKTKYQYVIANFAEKVYYFTDCSTNSTVSLSE